MYTQCPQCQTVFRVTATMLKAARGKVRCGRCAHVFNALTFLIDTEEEPTTTPTPAGPPSQAPPPSTTSRPSAAEKRYDDNTPFEEEEEALEARARPEETKQEPVRVARAADAQAEPTNFELIEEAGEEIILDSDPGAPDPIDGASDEVDELVLEDAGPLSVEEGSIDEDLTVEDASADEELAEEQAESPVDEELQAETIAGEELQLEPTDDTAGNVPEAALEFTASDPGNVFVEAPRVSLPRAVADAGDETAEHEILDVGMETLSSPEVITLEGDSVVVVDGAPGEETTGPAAQPGKEALPPRKPRTQEAIDLEVRQEIEKAFADDPTTRAEFILPSGKKVSLHRNQDEIEVEEVEAAEALARDTSRQRRTRIAWGIGGVVLAILLGFQVIHYNRQTLVQSAQIGPVMMSIYGAFGSELTPAWKVGAYDVRQWGAAADPRTGTVKVRASVTNGAEHAQPYPLLRLTLMNRFGERLRQSDIEPKDYLTQAPGTDQLLGAGQRVDASIAIVDPGDEAVNFEIDVCLRRNAAVTCASDALRQRS
jgi:predicted Zn finger-like uncharacterized protein